MALVQYSTQLFFPGGDPASNYLLSVWPRASNQLVPLFTDGTGMSPLSNPHTTDSDGFLQFWAAPGDYVTWLAGTEFNLTLDASVSVPVWPGLWTHDQTSPSSVWTVNHHFGVRPTVDVLLLWQHAETDVSHPSTETTVITFGAPVTGVAYLRR